VNVICGPMCTRISHRTAPAPHRCPSHETGPSGSDKSAQDRGLLQCNVTLCCKLAAQFGYWPSCLEPTEFPNGGCVLLQVVTDDTPFVMQSAVL